MAIRLFDKDTGRELAQLSTEQLADLKELLEEENPDDRDRFVNAEAVDFLEEHGADQGLCKLLREAVGDGEGIERSIDDIVVETKTPGLLLAPAGEGLAAVDLHLASVLGREHVLERVLDARVVREVDHVVVDTAPYLGLLTMNALVAADHLLVP